MKFRFFATAVWTAALVVPAWAGPQAAGSQIADNRPAGAAADAKIEVNDEIRGDIFVARKMYREAIDRYQLIKPPTALIDNKIGIAFQQLQQFDEAERWYRRASKVDRKYAQAVNNLGTIYYAKKNYRKATGQYEKALQLAPDSASFMSNLGMAWFARKNYVRATELLTKAMQIDPEILERRGTTGTTLLDRSSEERAKFHYYLAKTYAKDGRQDLALLYMRKSLEEGFKEREHYVKDPEFGPLQQVPEFQELLKLEPKVL